MKNSISPSAKGATASRRDQDHVGELSLLAALGQALVFGGQLRHAQELVGFPQSPMRVPLVRQPRQGRLQVGRRLLPPPHLRQDLPPGVPEPRLARPALQALVVSISRWSRGTLSQS